MNEKEKILKRLLYDANGNEELILERERCKELCFKYNSITPTNTELKREMIKKILKNIPEKIEITAPFYCDYGYNIEIGDNFYSNHNLIILDAGKVRIGRNVFIAPNCCITTAGHPIDVTKRSEGLEYAYPIEIGDNVWIGANVTILPGVKIGKNVVIGAGSVVNKDIPDDVIAVGNPCRVIKKVEQ